MAKILAIALTLALVAISFAQYNRQNQQNSWRNTQYSRTNTFNNVNNNQQVVGVGVNNLVREDTAEIRNQNVNVAYLQAFRQYTLDLVRQNYYYDAFVRSGFVSYCTFTLGHLLAVVNERVIDVPTQGIQQVLRLRANEVPVAYSGILDSFVEDNRVTPSSSFYTPDAQRQVTDNYQRLRTVREVLRLFQNVQAPSVINDNIRRTTQGVIDNFVVPQVPPFNDTVLGVHTNTFYYTSRFVVPFRPVGQRPFYVVDDQQNQQQQVVVDTVEATGTYPVVVSTGYSAVAVPLVGDRKHLVFVQPRVSVRDFLQNYVSEIFLTAPQVWQSQVVRVQVPVVNVTVGRNFVSQLNDLAGSQVQCVGTGNNVQSNFLHPIVQVVSQSITADGYEVAVANGVQVDRYVVNNVVRTGQNNQQRPVVVPDQIKIKTVREVDAGNVEQVQPNSDIVFDRPYFVYVHDVNLGAVSFTAVRNPVVVDVPTRQVRHHEVGYTNFDEVSKETRWNCGYDEAHVAVEHPVVNQVQGQVPVVNSCVTQH